MPAIPTTAEQAAHEREVLEDLVKSEGWRIYVRRCESELKGEGFFARITTALAKNDPVEPRVVHRTALELAGMLQWPQKRIEELTRRVRGA
jgi:hypothetical protein